jgi:hypothetical protein
MTKISATGSQKQAVTTEFPAIIIGAVLDKGNDLGWSDEKKQIKQAKTEKISRIFRGWSDGKRYIRNTKHQR